MVDAVAETKPFVAFKGLVEKYIMKRDKKSSLEVKRDGTTTHPTDAAN